MTTASPEELTQLLHAWSEGDEGALARLTPLVFDDLHRLARHYMRGERPGHTLQTTALVNEAFLRLRDTRTVRWQSRTHFLAVAARLMRRVLVDFARSRRALKRGGDAPHFDFDEKMDGVRNEPELTDLDAALHALARLDARKAYVVELRFFGGFSVEETAGALDVSPETVMRDWKFSKVWLLKELTLDSSARPSESAP